MAIETFDLGQLSGRTMYGNLSQSYSNALFGYNRVKTGDDRQHPNDNVGYTFFTRPMMNFSKENIRRDRLLYSYLTTEESAVESYCRLMLDPKLAKPSGENLHVPYGDNEQFFIPILSNNIKTATGVPDVAVDSYVSPSGSRKQQYNLLDGTDELNDSIDINLTFKNTYDDAVLKLFTIWIRYMVKVKEGIMTPYPGFIVKRLVDYHTRMFRLVMTEDKKYVKRIMATGPMYPDVNEVGKYFNVTEDKIYNDETSVHSVKMKCMGVEAYDPILLKEFNETSGAFHPGIKAINKGGKPEDHGLIKLSSAGKLENKHLGYCRINLATLELEWYVPIIIWQSAN